MANAKASWRARSIQTLTRCFWAETCYRHHRQKGNSHADALRRIGQHWLKIIYRMWTDQKPYDGMLYDQNQLKNTVLGFYNSNPPNCDKFAKNCP